MKKSLLLIFSILSLSSSIAQIEPVHFIEEVNYGTHSYIYDYEVIDDDFIIISLVDESTFNQTPVVSRIDKKGNLIWSTINQYSKPLSLFNSKSLRLMVTEYGELFAIIGNYEWSSKKRNIWKIDMATGEILSDNFHYSDYDDSYEIFDYDEEHLVSITQVKGATSQDIHELAIFHKVSNEVIKTYTLGDAYQEVTLGIDDVKNIYIGLDDKVTKYSGSDLDQPIWDLTLDNTEGITEIVFDNNGELFAHTRSPGDGGYIQRINRHSGALIWTALGSVSGTDVFLSDYIDAPEYIYSTYRHRYVGSVQADFQASKIRKVDGEIIWKGKHDLTLADLEENPSGNNAAAWELALDCEDNLYMTGYYGNANYGPGICGIVKVDGVDGSTVWDQTLTLFPDEHDTGSIGLAISVINDTLIVLPRLQEEDFRSGIYAAGLDIENGDIYYLDEISSQSCEFSSVNDLQFLGDNLVAATIEGKSVKSIEFESIEAIENIVIDADYQQYPGYLFSDEFSHCLTAYSKDANEQKTSIFINSKLNNSGVKSDTIIANSLNSRPLEIDGKWSYRTLVYGVEDEIHLAVNINGNGTDLEIVLEEDVITALDMPKRNTLLIEDDLEIMYLSKDRIKVYEKSDLSLKNNIDYPSLLNAYNHVVIDDSKICIVGNNANGNIALLMMDFSTGEVLWQVDTQQKGNAFQVLYDQSFGIYVSGITDDNLYVAKFDKDSGQLLWTLDDQSFGKHIIPMEAAIIPDRNTIAIAGIKKQDEMTSDGVFIVVSLQGNIVHIEEYKDELKAKSAVNSVVAGPDFKYYFGGSHNTAQNGKRGILYSADFSVIDEEAGISGIVYFDENQNGIRDPNELGIPNVKVQVDPIPGYTLTDANGRFFKLAKEGESYTVATFIDTSDFMLTTDSSSFTFEFSYSNPDIANNNFGYYTELKSSASINLTSDATRCNTDSRFYLNVVNEGFLLESGEIVLDFDPNVEFNSATIEPSEYLEDQNQLRWEFDNLLPFEDLFIAIDFKMPDEQNTGLVMKFESSVESDDLTVLDEYKYTPTVLCSYDPNDKLVMPTGLYDQNYTLFEDSILTYTVRFQNTGNAAAIDVVIRDTIDQNFDMSTFRVVNTSHNLRTDIDGRYIDFIFKDIYLIDSLTNEPESHGQVTYEIRLNDDVQNNVFVENVASIYFDFNPPIVTNTTQNMMVDMLPTNIEEIESQSYYELYPNPTYDEIFVVNQGQKPIDEIRIYDASGGLRMTTNQQRISTYKLSSGYYMMQILSEGRSVMLSFVKI